jgi:hypothetical protein
MENAAYRETQSRSGALPLVAALGFAFLPVFYGRNPAVPAPPAGAAAVDLQTEASVDRALLAHGVQRRDIDVHAIQGAVRLSGRVRSEGDRLAVLLAAGSAAGVRVLVDELRVEGEE